MAELRARRDCLEQAISQAPPGTARSMKIELSEVKEELVQCARELRELMPRHRISRGKAVRWSDVEGTRWEGLEDKTWQAVEGGEDSGEPLSDPEMMRVSLNRARKSRVMTSTQEAYMAELLDHGKRKSSIAAEHGKNRTTVSRTLARGRARLEQGVKAAYAVMRNQGEQNGGVTVIDLAVPEVLEGILNILTKRQRLYLYFYYGEWMSLREIAVYFGLASHSTVLRSIQAALDKIGALAMGDQVELRGWDELEERLLEHYNALDLESLEELSRPVHSPAKGPPPGFSVIRHHVLPVLRLVKPAWIVRDGERRSAALDDFHVPETGHWGSGRLLSALRDLVTRLGGETGDGRRTPGCWSCDTRKRAVIIRILRNLMDKLFDLLAGQKRKN